MKTFADKYKTIKEATLALAKGINDYEMAPLQEMGSDGWLNVDSIGQARFLASMILRNGDPRRILRWRDGDWDL